MILNEAYLTNILPALSRTQHAVLFASIIFHDLVIAILAFVFFCILIACMHGTAWEMKKFLFAKILVRFVDVMNDKAACFFVCSSIIEDIAPSLANKLGGLND